MLLNEGVEPVTRVLPNEGIQLKVGLLQNEPMLSNEGIEPDEGVEPIIGFYRIEALNLE